MNGERWYAARRERDVFPSRCERLRGQPKDGFATLHGVVEWLEQEGHVRRVQDTHPQAETPTRLEGWGDPFCGVLGSRNDPWESA